MSNIAIRVENLSKQYQIGRRAAGGHTFREAMLNSLTAPLRWFRGEQKSHETFRALDDVSLEIQQGQAVGIIGRNGAGKSTLLKVLSRITKPTKGRVDLYGRVASLLEVGTGFHSELSGRDNIYLNGAILGMSRREISSKFDEIVDFASVEKFLDTPVKHYSSGMYVRLAFAVAAHLEPEILVVDEVLAVGDAEFQKKCLGKMDDVAKGGRTVLFVSHNMAAINRLCSYAILMNAGKILAQGSTAEVTEKYLTGLDEEGGARVWNLENAPGTEDLKLISVRVLGENGNPISVVDVHEQLNLEIEYRVEKPGLRFRCALQFYTHGVLAFATLEPVEEVRLKAGKYYSSVTIPPHLLAENEYIVGVSIFNSSGGKNHFVVLKDAVTFQVYDSMTGPSARGDYAQNFSGIVRPLLKWHTDLHLRS
jgi:lipopolysaccharide transport system ATP-binding protein